MFFHPMTRPKILQIIPRLGMGGVEQGTLDIAKALIENGFEAYILTQEGEKIPIAQSLGAKVFQLPVASKNPFTIGQNILKIHKFCKENSINLVHARSRAPAWSAWQACHLANLPFVTTFHGTYNFSNSFKKYYNSVMVRGHKVIAISEFIKHHIQENYHPWVKEKQLEVIHRGIDCTYFDPDHIDLSILNSLKIAWNLPSDEPIYLMPGRLTAWKGHRQVLRMIPYVPKGVFVFLGSCQGRTHYLNSLKQEAEALGIMPRLRFIESCTTMREAYAACDGVIHASTDPEAFGRVIAEAQAMGKPIVVSPLGAPKEIIIDKHTGWICDPYNAQELASICASMPNYNTADFQQKCRNRVLDLFSLPTMAKKTLAIYDALLTKTPRGS
jgi:glycosyltransferase involved in cell wall biosynthesis